MMLFSMLSEAQGGKSIAFLSRHFGLSSRQMTNVIRHFLPILMRGIQKNFAKQGGLTSLLKTLDHDNYASYFEDPNIYNNPQVRNSGNMILEKALGSEEVQKQIMHRIYLSTGIDPDTLFLVLPYVTTLALSALYIKAHTSLNPPNTATALEYHGRPQAQPRPTPNAPQYQPVNHQPANNQPQYAAPAVQQQQPVSQPRTMQPGVIPHPASRMPQQQLHHTNAMPQGYPQTQTQAQSQTQVQVQPQQAHMQPQQQQTQMQPQQQPQPQVQAQVQHHPQQQPHMPPQQEKLPNIIRQAQAAHEQKTRKPAKKGRLSQMLKAPFKVASQTDDTPTQQQQIQQHYNTQPQPQQPVYHQQPQYQPVAHTPAQVPARPQVPSRKYISLQEKLTSQLPWYEQTG